MFVDCDGSFARRGAMSMNYSLPIPIATLSLASACVLSEPIGSQDTDTEGEPTSSSSTSEPAPTTASGDDSETGPSDPTGGPAPGTGSTESGDETGPGEDLPFECNGMPNENFFWEWNLAGYEPEQDPGSYYYDADSVLPLDCDVDSYVISEGELRLELDCEAGGEAIPQQTFEIFPAPDLLAVEVEAGEPLAIQFRPERRCPNGCFIADGGWMSIRRVADNELLLGLAKVNRLLEPVDEFAPLSVTTRDSRWCPRVFDDIPCESGPGWIEVPEVVMSDGVEEISTDGPGAGAWPGYSMTVNHAVEGMYDFCSADGGDRAEISLMIEKM